MTKTTTFRLDLDTWIPELGDAIKAERLIFGSLEAALGELYTRRDRGQRAMLTAVVGDHKQVTLMFVTDLYPRPDAIAELVALQGAA